MTISEQDIWKLDCSPEIMGVLKNLIERIEALESKSTRFKKPTLQEVQSYMAEKHCVGYIAEGESFINYFEQVGWVVGSTKKPMKAWKAAVNNWLKNNSSKPAPEVKAAKVDAMRNIHDTSW